MPAPFDDPSFILSEDENKSYYLYYLKNDDFINYVLSKKELSDENIYTCIECFELYLKKQKKIKPKVERNIKYCFITLQNFQQRLSDLDKFQLFIQKIDYLYHEGHWIVEAGKADPPNVHIHMLVKIINPRKHKNMLGIHWGKIFDNNILIKDFYKLKQHRDVKGMPDYPEWCQEKIDYFKNENKGSHENSIDLNLSGVFGVQG